MVSLHVSAAVDVALNQKKKKGKKHIRTHICLLDLQLSREIFPVF